MTVHWQGVGGWGRISLFLIELEPNRLLLNDLQEQTNQTDIHFSMLCWGQLFAVKCCSEGNEFCI